MRIKIRDIRLLLPWRKKYPMTKTAGSSITNHPYLAFMVVPHPERANRPYGADTKNKETKVSTANPNSAISKIVKVFKATVLKDSIRQGDKRTQET